MYQYTGSFEKIVDADTAYFLVDVGFGVQLKHMEFRFSSINAPEQSTPLGQQAKAFAAAWFAANPVVIIDSVATKSGMDDKEKWGRWLGTFTPVGGGESLNQLLVDNNLAKPYNGKGPKPV